MLRSAGGGVPGAPPAGHDGAQPIGRDGQGGGQQVIGCAAVLGAQDQPVNVALGQPDCARIGPAMRPGRGTPAGRAHHGGGHLPPTSADSAGSKKAFQGR